MSTDLSSACSPEELLHRTNLAGVEFHNCSATTLLHTVWKWTEEIWQRVEEDHYTNHDLKHSCRIIEHFMSFDPRYRWSGYEKLLFVISALIHDVGMQYNFWAGKTAGLGYKERLTLEEVRKRHIETGSNLVLAYVYGKSNAFQLRDLYGKSSGDLDAIHRAAHIAFSHSGKQFLEILCSDVNHTWFSRTLEGGKYRPRLLAGILKLCDELDGSYLRIRDPRYIWGWDFDDVARHHWLACHFIESTEIKLDPEHTSTDLTSQVWKITLRWRVPEQADENLISHIRDLLGSMREGKINQEIKVINDFYDLCGEPEHRLNILPVRGLGEDPIRFPFPITSESKKVIIRVASNPKTPTDEAAEVVHAAKAHTHIQHAATTSSDAHIIQHTPTKQMSIEDDLNQWFKDNREIGHFELVSGEHTDTYVHCRTLVSDQTLLRRLADKLFIEFKDQSIDAVLAVGTSAIPLAVNVAFRLNRSVTFTFSKDISDRSYHEIELEPNVTQEQRILIIDDILSGGTVAKEILKRLYDHNKRPSAIFHRAVFRLGDRHYQDDRISNYDWFIHIPQVRYFASGGSCELCKQSPAVKESDIA